ncbi:copper amine oxidase [Lipomyces oligophaga]|uniref:copper amine oxidase n=1 Tax=Lipomyces oligophaga TaxID=45792 RepID=UPI0034CE9509
MLERLSQISSHTKAAPAPSFDHPLDPLSGAEIRAAAAIVKAALPEKTLAFNVISLADPPKAEFLAWAASPETVAKPAREVDIVALEAGVNGVLEGLVDLTAGKLIKIKHLDGVQPILTVHDLAKVELAIRKDPKVIEQCIISGLTAEDMERVYCDPWTIGYDERWGTERRLQQAIMYYRSDIDDSQYSHPLDFCPIFDTETAEVIAIDIPPVRRPVSKRKHANFHAAAVEALGGYRTNIKPIYVEQPEGVSFKITGREIEWQNFKFHVGFNYREGIVLNNITYNDHGEVRPLFYRISLSEMVVPYGCPDHPHHRKHAFDLGEYGGGYMTNSLALGCDCKGVIHYMDAEFPDRKGESIFIKNAICIHEEDDGVLFKHSDFRDNYATSVLARGVKLIVSQIFTAANYEYMVYWVFHMDGTIQLEIKLTGILNTFVMNEDEDLHGFATQVYPGVSAQNHQHLFCLRVNPMVDGLANSIQMVDAVPSSEPVGSPANKYGNAFMPKATVFKTAGEAITDYNGATSRSWDMINPNRKHPYSGKPSSYKLVSREVPSLLPKPGSLVSNRAAFARHAVHVTPYVDRQFYPAGTYVPQTSGVPSRGLPEWIGDGTGAIENTDVVLWHTFGITHFPAPEDFPIMPAEPMSLLLRPRNFFVQNPALDVPPSHLMTTSQVIKAGGADAVKVDSLTDKVSRLAFGESAEKCCK